MMYMYFVPITNILTNFTPGENICPTLKQGHFNYVGIFEP